MKLSQNIIPNVIKIAVLTSSLYILVNFLPAGVRSFRFLWGPMTLILIFMAHTSVLKSKAMTYLILYGTISIVFLQYSLWRHMSDWDRLNLLNEFYSLFVFSTILFYYSERRDFKGLADLAKLGFYCVLITVIMSNIALFLIPRLYDNPFFLRVLPLFRPDFLI